MSPRRAAIRRPQLLHRCTIARARACAQTLAARAAILRASARFAPLHVLITLTSPFPPKSSGALRGSGPLVSPLRMGLRVVNPHWKRHLAGCSRRSESRTRPRRLVFKFLVRSGRRRRRGSPAHGGGGLPTSSAKRGGGLQATRPTSFLSARGHLQTTRPSCKNARRPIKKPPFGKKTQRREN